MTSAMDIELRRSPVVEATVEFRFAQKIYAAQFEKISRSIKKRYENKAPIRSADMNLDLNSGVVTAKLIDQGVKFSSSDGLNVVILTHESIATSRMSPYHGWEQFCEDIRLNLSDVFEVSGFRKLSRIGARYINRIDIPIDGHERIDLGEYFNLTLNAPVSVNASLAEFFYRTVYLIEELGAVGILMLSSTPPELINHHSINLDIDHFKDANLPENEFDAFDFMGRLRDYRTKLFGELITQKAMELYTS